MNPELSRWQRVGDYTARTVLVGSFVFTAAVGAVVAGVGTAKQPNPDKYSTTDAYNVAKAYPDELASDGLSILINVTPVAFVAAGVAYGGYMAVSSLLRRRREA